MEGKEGKQRKTGTKIVEGKELNEGWFEGTKGITKDKARTEARGRKKNTWHGESLTIPPGAHPFWCRIPVGCRLDTSFRPLECQLRIHKPLVYLYLWWDCRMAIALVDLKDLSM